MNTSTTLLLLLVLGLSGWMGGRLLLRPESFVPGGRKQPISDTAQQLLRAKVCMLRVAGAVIIAVGVTCVLVVATR
jgi:hypothetical protein